MSSFKDFLLDTHKKLYEENFNKAEYFIQQKPDQLVSYAERFNQELPNRGVAFSEAELLKKIEMTDVLLFGDFHTLETTMASFLSILEKTKFQTKRHIVIALESFYPEDQNMIDLFFTEAINDQYFLTQTAYMKKWGFPWKENKKLFDFARVNKIKISGINDGNAQLAHRDKNIAQNIFQLKTTYPQAIIFCLIGEHHLAEGHLPFQLKKIAKKNKEKIFINKIFCNIESLYLNKKNFLSQNSYLKLTPDTFCLFDAPPWVKWFSFVIWEDEQRNVGEYDDEEAGSDLDFHFYGVLKLLQSLLSLAMSELDFHDISVQMLRKDCLAKNIVFPGVCFTEKKKLIEISNFSVTNLAYAAGFFLFYKQRKNTLNFNLKDPFHKILYAAFSHVCVKMLNPNSSAYAHIYALADKDYFTSLAEDFYALLHSAQPLDLVPFIQADRQMQGRVLPFMGFFLAEKIFGKMEEEKLSKGEFAQLVSFLVKAKNIQDIQNLFAKAHRQAA